MGHFQLGFRAVLDYKFRKMICELNGDANDFETIQASEAKIDRRRLPGLTDATETPVPLKDR